MQRKRLLLFGILLFAFAFTPDVFAFSSSNYRNKSLCGVFEVAGFHSDGVIDPVSCHGSYDAAKAWMRNNGADDLAILTKVNGVTEIIDANVALLDLTIPPDMTYFYTNPELSGYAYTYMDTGSLYGGVDGALLDASYSSSKGTWTAKVRTGNCTAWIEKRMYEIVPITWVRSSSSYTVTSESIRHNYVEKIQNTYNGSRGSTIGPKPSMLSAGTYYSYDGHYFYRDLTTMLKDYRNGTYQHAVNANNVYYNYYMYLSNHTRTSYSSVNIDEYIRNSLGVVGDANGTTAYGGRSRLYGKGTFFYYAQEKYGVNAVLALSLSRNETGNGTSNLAVNKNNGFGLNAVDSSPTESANWYASFAESILGYASKWITYGYAHPRDWRYFGPQFGDKWSGMNVKYASDTFWSEKMAANYYALDKAKGLQDYDYYQLGVATRQVNAMSDASNSSKFIYSYPEAEDAVVIVGEKKGESVNGNNLWYQVVSDLNIDSNYNEITSGNYNWNGTVYVPAAYIKKINQGKRGYVSPNSVTEYQDKYYTYDLYVENTVLKPKVAKTVKDTNYYYDPALTSQKSQNVVKDRYVMVYTTAYNKAGTPVSYLITSDYFYDQKEWVKADTIQFVDSDYGKVTISTGSNDYTWVNSVPQETANTVIGGQFNNSYVPILGQTTASDGRVWYKVPVDLNGTEQEFGWTLQASPGVAVTKLHAKADNHAPVIRAQNRSIVQGSKWDPKAGVSATDQEDGNLTAKLVVLKDAVQIDVPGTYEVIYSVTDKSNLKTTKTIQVTVTENKKPVLVAEDMKITIGKEFHEKEGVTANDAEDGDLTSKIVVTENKVNTKALGSYPVTYSVTDSYNQTTEKTITVTVIEDQKPEITTTTTTAYLNRDFEPLKIVKATDFEDGDLTKAVEVVKNDVDTTKIGPYEVTYRVRDSYGHEVTKTFTITVQEKQLEEKPGLFYFDSLKEEAGKLVIKGYHAIQGIDHKKDTAISYKLVFQNITTKEETSQDLERILDTKEMGRPVYSSDGKDYTYSWFKGALAVDDLEDGDYRIYILTESDDYFAKTVVSNKVLKQQVATYTGKKTVTTRNNYQDSHVALELIVRNKAIAPKTANSVYNQYNQYRTLTFEDNLLHLKGTAYSMGMNLAKDKTVKREIIFENTKNYEQYRYSIGSTTEGLYKVGTTLGDGFDKTRAWFDTKLDLSKIPKGNYAIYLATESNISDYGEFTELLLRSLDDVKKEINGNTYSFTVRKDLRYRIELHVT